MKRVEIRESEVPALGFGTWELRGDECYEAVRHALDIGYRHLDTAQAYGNEQEVGRAIADSDVDRTEVFLTTKLWRSNLEPDAVRRTTEDSLRQLAVDYVNLLLIHWPNESVPLDQTLGAMSELREAGKVLHVGVSNFPPGLVKEALDHTDVFCDQVEYHPYLQQDELRDLAVDRDFLLTAYSPLGKGRVVGDDTLTAIGDAHGKTAAQVALRWLVQQDHVAAIPRSSSAEHREANFDIFDFALSEDEMARIDRLGRGDRVIDPGFAPDWDG